MNRPNKSFSSYDFHHAVRNAILLCSISLLLIAPPVTTVARNRTLRRTLSAQQSPGVPGASAQKKDALSEHERHKPIERELGAGESHSYRSYYPLYMMDYVHVYL